MTNENSFEELQYWYNEILRTYPIALNALLIVGTKSDQIDNIRIHSDDGIRQANEWGGTHLIISSKNGLNIDGMFTLMLAMIKKTQAQT
jgi:hypothetical protein